MLQILFKSPEFLTGTEYEPDMLADKVEGILASTITSFDMMLGDHDFEMCKASSHPDVCRAMILLNAVIVNIVILNLLIALMGESVSRVQETARLHALRERAQLIVQYERSQSNKQHQDCSWHPTFLHMLRPQAELSQESGVIEATLKEQSGQILRLESKLEQHCEEQAKKLDEIMQLLQAK